MDQTIPHHNSPVLEDLLMVIDSTELVQGPVQHFHLFYLISNFIAPKMGIKLSQHLFFLKNFNDLFHTQIFDFFTRAILKLISHMHSVKNFLPCSSI